METSLSGPNSHTHIAAEYPNTEDEEEIERWLAKQEPSFQDEEPDEGGPHYHNSNHTTIFHHHGGSVPSRSHVIQRGLCSLALITWQ